MYDEEEYILGVLEAGADGYLLKQTPGEELQNAVVRIHAGERVLHPRALRTLIDRATNRAEPAIEALSEREREVLQLMAEGKTSKEIAAALDLRPKTVENHRARILDKLGAANSAAAVRAALARGLIGAVNSPRSI
jgi:DNA-binding NarL/FixJ family response regulator